MKTRIFATVITAAILAGTVVYSTAQKPPEVAPSTAAAPPAGPKYFKGNLHTHSLWSDGDDYPEMIADWYKTHGYQFLAFTEHNLIPDGEKWVASESTAIRKKATEKYAKRFGESWLERRVEKDVPQVRLKPLREYRSLFEEPQKFHLISASEITHSFSKRPVHMNAINLRDQLKPLDGASAEETIRINARLMAEQSKKTGWPILSILNHPNWKWGVNAEDFIGVEELQYFEIQNGHPGTANYGDATHASTERMWDILLAVRLGKMNLPIIYGVGTDDSHSYHEFGAGKTNPGRSWIMARCTHLTPEALVRAMKTGDFYVSTGVSLDEIHMGNGELKVAIRTEPGVKYTTEFFATMRGAPLEATAVKDKDGTDLPVTKRYSDEVGQSVGKSTDATPSYKFTGKELYVRARITSDKPHPNPYAKGDTEVAWTQPFVP
jgi:hypothetical protein